MYQHPALHRVVIRDRVDGLRLSAEATAYIRRVRRRHTLLAAARRRTGWLLVDMGLRMAVPRAGTKHPMAPGQR